MRTTFTIDDALTDLLQRLAYELEKPFREIVYTALCRGLTEITPSAMVTVAESAHQLDLHFGQ